MNLLTAIVNSSETAGNTACKMLKAIQENDSENARDYAIQAVREARPGLILIDVLKKIHGTEEDSAG